ncbi:hypothetical protein HGRIS_005638 [Hohenbuehelia grisea]|uniref:Uncharacterized protein n=1 Tax=Hohenbuehelia grisea TaxID=104357 RepID=A0ABR3JYJ0_9AGAR
MFRQAYLSASPKLNQMFHGRRLQAMTQKYPVARTNMWPYLRQRQDEALERRRSFDLSFLPNSLGNPRPISEHLWCSPDHEKQATVAVRFLLTRLWFLYSVGPGRNGSSWEGGTVVDARVILEDEVWAIRVSHESSSARQGPATHEETLYILEATGEVIGQAPSHEQSTSDSKNEPNQNKADFPRLPVLRADWTFYISELAVEAGKAGNSPRSSLLERVAWTNHEEYERGISKLWLRRIANEGVLGSAKRLVAERYVLASVVANGISGKWMSAMEMRQEFDGLPELGSAPRPVSKTRQVQLFLPAHHHVESLHFTTASGRALHPALAVVRTPAREYYIFKDNGMQVGCEEEGVAEVWMSLIGCTETGLAMAKH